MRKTLLSLLAASAISLPAFGQFSIQKVVIEEFTGAWCGWCPDGAVVLQNILDSNPDAIGVSIHNGDAMVSTAGTEVDVFYNSTGYPSGCLNREGASVSRGTWTSTANSITSGASVVTVGIDSVMFDAGTREINLKVTAQFTGNSTGDHRFLFFVVEDNVTGTGSGYNQSNYLNTTPGHPYYGAGDPIIGFNHRHVLRAMPSGAWGISGVIPSTCTFGTYAEYHFSYTLPASYDENEILLVGGVSKFDGAGVGDREILNAEEVHLDIPASVNPAAEENKMSIVAFPNPTSERATVQFTLDQSTQLRMEVIDMKSQIIAVLGEGVMAKGSHTLNWNTQDASGNAVASGLYSIRLVTESGQSEVTRLMITR